VVNVLESVVHCKKLRAEDVISSDDGDYGSGHESFIACTNHTQGSTYEISVTHSFLKLIDLHFCTADEVQRFSIYEINEHDRDSPCFLPFSLINVSKTKPASITGHHEGLIEGLQTLWSTVSSTLSGGGIQHSLGDMVPFSNKVPENYSFHKYCFAWCGFVGIHWNSL
jgi:hypothetical protein